MAKSANVNVRWKKYIPGMKTIFRNSWKLVKVLSLGKVKGYSCLVMIKLNVLPIETLFMTIFCNLIVQMKS